VSLSYELVEFEYILLSGSCYVIFLFLLLCRLELVLALWLRSQLQHLLNQSLMVGSKSIQWILFLLLFNLLFAWMLLKQIQKLPRCQFSSNHSIIILNLRRCPRLQQQINNFPIPQLRRIVKRSIMIMIPLIKTNPSTNQQLTILQMIRLNCYM